MMRFRREYNHLVLYQQKVTKPRNSLKNVVFTSPEVSAQQELEAVGRELFDRNYQRRKIRLMGLTVSGFPEIPPSGMVQMELPLEFQ